MKICDVNAEFKNGSSLYKNNYRSLAVLPSVTTVLTNQMLPLFSNFFSQTLSAYRQRYNTQHALLKLVEALVYPGFDFLNHERVLSKVGAHGFCRKALQPACSQKATGQRTAHSPPRRKCYLLSYKDQY